MLYLTHFLGLGPWVEASPIHVNHMESATLDFKKPEKIVQTGNIQVFDVCPSFSIDLVGIFRFGQSFPVFLNRVLPVDWSERVLTSG